MRWILKENCETAYGRDHDLGNISTLEEFIGSQPLTTFTDYEEYVERIARGEKYVMSKADVVFLPLSSGTTGKNKMYPFTLGGALTGFAAFAYSKYRMRALFKNVGLKRNFLFKIFHPPRTSEGGIPMGGLTQWYSIPPFESNITPIYFKDIGLEAPSFYVQAIFALAELELGRIDGFSSDLMYAFFNFMVHHRDAICQAIHTGTIDCRPDLDEGIRQALDQSLHPNPARAAEVKQLLEGPKEGLALRLWPGMSLCIVGDTFLQIE